MSQRIFKSSSWSAVPVADATPLVNQQFMALQGATASQLIRLGEVEFGGQAVSSSPTSMQTSRDSTVGATLTPLTVGESDAAMTPLASVLVSPALPFTQSTTKPQRSATAGLVNQSFNLSGGIARWVAYPGKEMIIFGNAVNAGEVSTSAFTGSTTGPVGGHYVYEVD